MSGYPHVSCSLIPRFIHFRPNMTDSMALSTDSGILDTPENSSISRILQHSILQLCNEHIGYTHKLQILGVLCMTVDDEKQELVVKVNNTLKRVSPALPTKEGNALALQSSYDLCNKHHISKYGIDGVELGNACDDLSTTNLWEYISSPSSVTTEEGTLSKTHKRYNSTKLQRDTCVNKTERWSKNHSDKYTKGHSSPGRNCIKSELSKMDEPANPTECIQYSPVLSSPPVPHDSPSSSTFTNNDSESDHDLSISICPEDDSTDVYYNQVFKTVLDSTYGTLPDKFESSVEDSLTVPHDMNSVSGLQIYKESCEIDSMKGKHVFCEVEKLHTVGRDSAVKQSSLSNSSNSVEISLHGIKPLHKPHKEASQIHSPNSKSIQVHLETDESNRSNVTHLGRNDNELQQSPKIKDIVMYDNSSPISCQKGNRIETDFMLDQLSVEGRKRRRRAPDDSLTREEIAEYMGQSSNSCTHFKCRFCNMEVNDLAKYLHHTLTSHNAYICHQCGKSFTTKSSLLRHRPIHTGMRRFACTICKKTFYRKDKCKAHIKRHLGVSSDHIDKYESLQGCE